MGVSGLTKYLRSQAAHGVKIIEKSSSTCSGAIPMTLIVDGLSLCYYLRAKCKQPCFYYLEVYKYECESFLSWLESYNITLESVIFDGVFETKKSATRVSRRFNRVRNLAFAENSLLPTAESKLDSYRHGQALHAGQDSSSVSPFRAVLIDCLRRKNIKVIVAKGEADAFIAKRCKETPQGFVLGDDSDFLIMSAPLVLLSSINYVSSWYAPLDSMSSLASSSDSPSSPPEEEQFVCEFFAPEAVLACLKISSNLLPYLSVLVGNDYSSYNLALKFAKGAGFAGKASNSNQRIRHTLAWLQKTSNVHSALQHLFRKQQCQQDFEMALKATRASLTPDESNLPPEPVKSNQETSGALEEGKKTTPTDGEGDTWTLKLEALHRAALVPPFVLGVVMHRKYWNPVIYDGEAIASAFLPLRNRFYRAIFRLAFNGTSGLEPQKVVEVTGDQEIWYDIDMEPSDDDLDLAVLKSTSAKSSPHKLLAGLGLDSWDPSLLLALVKECDAGEVQLLLTICLLKAVGIISSGAVVDLLLQQYVVLNNGEWHPLVRGAEAVTITKSLASVSGAFTLGHQWFKVVCRLSGDPLDGLAENLVVFDGMILALLEGGNASVMRQVDEKHMSALRGHAERLQLV